MGAIRVLSFEHKRKRFALLLLLPAIITIFGLLLAPMVYAFWMSLNVIDFQTREYHFVFFRNYGEIITDSRTANSFITTIYFSISTIVVCIVLAFLLALLLNLRSRRL